MRPFTYEIPKALLPLKNKPLLEDLLTNLRDDDVKDIIISINKEQAKIKEAFGNGSRLGVNISYVEEASDLGTGGALAIAKQELKSSPFIIVHGDILTDIDFQELVAFHQASGKVITMALKTVKNTREFGQISLKGNTVTNFQTSGSKEYSNLVNTGIYVCNQEIFKYLPNEKKFNFE